MKKIPGKTLFRNKIYPGEASNRQTKYSAKHIFCKALVCWRNTNASHRITTRISNILCRRTGLRSRIQEYLERLCFEPKSIQASSNSTNETCWKALECWRDRRITCDSNKSFRICNSIVVPRMIKKTNNNNVATKRAIQCHAMQYPSTGNHTVKCLHLIDNKQRYGRLRYHRMAMTLYCQLVVLATIAYDRHKKRLCCHGRLREPVDS